MHEKWGKGGGEGTSKCLSLVIIIVGDIAKYCKCKMTKIYFTRLTCEQRACLIFTNLNIQKAFFLKISGMFISGKSSRLGNGKNILNQWASLPHSFLMHSFSL